MDKVKFKTRFDHVVPKGSVGSCISSIRTDNDIKLVLIEFKNYEKFWFMERDLIKLK